jgi:hypothetical protein
MRKTRLTTMLAGIALAATACGTATTPSVGHRPGGPSGSGPTSHSAPDTVRDYARHLLAGVNVPPGSAVAGHAPSKALESLPESPSLSKTPVVLSRYWTIDQQVSDVHAWLEAHRPGGGLVASGSGMASTPPAPYISYRVDDLPGRIGAAYVYVQAISTGPTSSAIGAWAVALRQPARPEAEVVPVHGTTAVISWSLAIGGTPVLKKLDGAAAEQLVRAFNALRVDVGGKVFCPMIPTRYGDVLVKFQADGHTWKVDIPACPDIRVTRDGDSLPNLAFGDRFMHDVRSYTGGLPRLGPPQAPGGVIPQHQAPTPR